MRQLLLQNDMDLKTYPNFFISLESKYDDMDIKDVLPDPSTISRISSKIAEWVWAGTLHVWPDDKKNKFLFIYDYSLYY